MFGRTYLELSANFSNVWSDMPGNFHVNFSYVWSDILGNFHVVVRPYQGTFRLIVPVVGRTNQGTFRLIVGRANTRELSGLLLVGPVPGNFHVNFSYVGLNPLGNLF